jgi:hypothetical protein
MRRSGRFTVRFFCVAVVLAAVAADLLSRTRTADAQLGDGEYCLYQPGNADPVGWVRVGGDHTQEWWAYIDGEYGWAGSANTSASPWHLTAVYTGSGGSGTYVSWKNDVLQRAPSQGRTIVFQNHSVAEEAVEN